MKKRIYTGILALAVLTLILVSGICLLFFNYSLKRQAKEELIEEAAYVSRAYEETPDGAAFCAYMGNAAGVRLTLVAPDGSVLYDSEADASEMENHLERPEIQEALATGQGFSSRLSKTLREETFYEAVLLIDGNILRLSDRHMSGFAVFRRILPLLLGVTAVILLCAFLAARHITGGIVETINGIDLKEPLKQEVFPELKPLLTRMENQNQQISRQMAEIDQQMAEIEQADAIRKEFTANVSHELKTPLTSISGFAEMIENGMAQKEDIPVFAGKIREEAARLLVLINDILKLSRMEEGSGIQPKEVVDLCTIGQEVWERLLPVAEKRDISFAIEGTSVMTLAVRSMMYDMIYNLCENAIKYNREQGKVLLEIYEEDDHPVVRVTDTGIGIPAKHQERIFERFYRVDKSHSRQTGGTGLGLSIVKHAVEIHGGQIEVHSREGVGTVMKIYL